MLGHPGEGVALEHFVPEAGGDTPEELGALVEHGDGHLEGEEGGRGSEELGALVE